MSTAMAEYKAQETEAMFMARVCDLALLKGWKWMHIRPGLNERGRYRTPVSGPLGAGWPDLVLVRTIGLDEDSTRLLFVELKAQGRKPTGLQSEVLGVLSSIPFAEVYVWRPSDWELIMETLN